MSTNFPKNPDSRAVRALKQTLPAGVKGVVEQGIRAATARTARWRPGPDFLVIGTKRGGTTTLWNALAAHPQIQPMVPAAKHLKSPHYFYWHHHRGPDWYRGHFPTQWSRRRHAERFGASLVGEASPMYLFDPRVPARVAQTLPNVKVVVSLRDPVRRAISHWSERVKEGVETLPFAEALAAEPERLAGEWERVLAEPDYYSRPLDWFSYRLRGEYATQLRRWYDAVDPAHVLVLRAEDLYADQATTLNRVFDFLGLDRQELPAQWRNRTEAPAIAQHVLDDLAEHYRTPNQHLADLLGTPAWWPITDPQPHPDRRAS